MAVAVEAEQQQRVAGGPRWRFRRGDDSLELTARLRSFVWGPGQPGALALLQTHLGRGSAADLVPVRPSMLFMVATGSRVALESVFNDMYTLMSC